MTTRPSALSSIRLRRDGTVPLQFDGWPIARHDGYVARAGAWHDLSLYRNAAGGYVVEIAARCADEQQVLSFPGLTIKPARYQATRSAPEPATRPAPCQATQPAPSQATPFARCHATMFATLDDALTALEDHDASADLCPSNDAPALARDDVPLSPAALVLRAAALQAFCQDVERRYRIGVGAMLAAIGLRTI